MINIELIIKIPEEDWKFIKEADGCRWSRAILDGVINGTPLTKGHGRIIDESQIHKCGWNYIKHHAKTDAPTIIEADKQYEAKVITCGNCMMCGKELTEGLFFCKECEDIIDRYKRESEQVGNPDRVKGERGNERRLYNLDSR